MMFDADVETMFDKELKVVQFERLQSTLNRAYLNVAHYRKSFEKAGVMPEDVTSLNDVRQLPFTTRQDIERGYPYDMFAVPLREVVRIHTSSGHARKPIVTGYTANDLKAWARLMARFLIGTGVNKEDVIQIAFRYGPMTGGLGFHAAAEFIGTSVIPSDVGNTQEQVIMMNDYLTSVIACTPGYALVLLKKIEEMKINPKSLRLRRAILGGEHLSDSVRKVIEGRLGVEVFNSYGLSVVMGPGIAGECSAHEGLHLYEDYFIPEIINPETGEVLGPGQKGELVITTLMREAFPLIRYRTGDITAIKEGNCPCGRSHIRLQGFYGRIDETVKIKGVSVSPERIHQILSDVAIDTRMQLHIYREELIEKVDLYLEVKEALFFDELKAQKAFIEKIEDAIHAGTRVRMKIKIIPKSAFKDDSQVFDERT